MKKYIIAIVLFCLSLFLIDNVYAADNTDNWGVPLSKPSLTGVFRCGSTYCDTELSVSANEYLVHINDVTNMTTNGNGLMIAYKLQNDFLKDYVYSISTYICSDYDANFLYKKSVTSGSWGGLQTNDALTTNLYLTELSNMNKYPYEELGSFAKCGVITDIFKSNVNSRYYGLNFTINKNVSSYTASFIGYSLQVLGKANLLTTNQLNSAIANSGFATADSIEDVQQAQQQLKTEIQVMQEQQEQTNEKLDETNKELGEMNDNITNSNTTGATDSAGGFFEGFSSDTFGLTSIITAPLNLIKSITSKICTPLNLKIPFVNKNMQLPCMSTIYTNYFGSFLTIYQTITFGIISYWVCIRIFALVKDFKNPDHDEIEVMDL